MKRIIVFILINLFAGISFADTCDSFTGSSPRGLSCFYCMHKNAPGKADPIVDVLLKSCLSDVTLSFVTDGSFGYDESVITSAIQKITDSGQNFWLHLYLYNGPAQRRWKSDAFKSFAIMDPISFRSGIVSDKRLRKKFGKEVRKIIPILQFAASKKVHVSLAPGLEDNLDKPSFLSAIKLIKRNLPKALLPKLVRSNCGDCAAGNESSIPRGIFQEVHTARSEITAKNGVVTNDGDFVRFEHEMPYEIAEDKTIEALLPVMKKAGEMNSLFHLWVPKFQDSRSDMLPYAPDKREFKKPTEKERDILIEFLRNGL